MTRNRGLASDYVRRGAIRLRALDVLMDAESWADVVREAQEIVELSLKGLLRAYGVTPPRVHDVSDILVAEQARLPAPVVSAMERLVRISRELRRDRELAFYGAEDLTPSDFYSRADAERARDGARFVVQMVTANVQHTPSRDVE
jgi:HEPN domain-containing protein